MIIESIDKALSCEACLELVCQQLNLAARTVQRWPRQCIGTDRRCGPVSDPPNNLNPTECRRRLLRLANAAPCRNISLRQTVPKLADTGIYVAAESTFYRILGEKRQISNRQRSLPFVTAARCQVRSWDITYLNSPVRGSLYYPCMILDVWSRRIVQTPELFDDRRRRHLPLNTPTSRPIQGFAFSG